MVICPAVYSSHFCFPPFEIPHENVPHAVYDNNHLDTKLDALYVLWIRAAASTAAFGVEIYHSSPVDCGRDNDVDGRIGYSKPNDVTFALVFP